MPSNPHDARATPRNTWPKPEDCRVTKLSFAGRVVAESESVTPTSLFGGIAVGVSVGVGVGVGVPVGVGVAVKVAVGVGLAVGV